MVIANLIIKVGIRMTMVITVNGKKEQIEKGTTVRQILTDRNVRPEIVAVEINGEIIERDEYATTQLSSGDIMEFLHYMAGGAALAFLPCCEAILGTTQDRLSDDFSQF